MWELERGTVAGVGRQLRRRNDDGLPLALMSRRINAVPKAAEVKDHGENNPIDQYILSVPWIFRPFAYDGKQRPERERDGVADDGQQQIRTTPRPGVKDHSRRDEPEKPKHEAEEFHVVINLVRSLARGRRFPDLGGTRVEGSES
jgi:hypothetical protein